MSADLPSSLENETKVCVNCGGPAPGRFCPSCGQSTNIGLPSAKELVLDGFGAVFSYDSKVWRTLGTLIRHPGKLTEEYFAGRRARYLSPFQTFFWLQTLAFFAHRDFFLDDAATIDAKSRFL